MEENAANEQGGAPDRRVVLGIRMPQRIATEVKVEAARKGLSVAAFFEEVWSLHKAGATGK